MRLREETSTWKAQNPEFARGLLSAIAWAEGTRTKDGKIGYDIMFGGNKFNDFSRHPDTVNRTPGYASAAAGAYQFMPKTWEMISKELGLNDFSPESQDIAALALAKKRLPGGLNSINKAGGLTPELLAKLAPEWASFPTLAGKSYYGQPVKSYDAVNKAFLEGKNNAGAGAVGTMQTPTTLALNSANTTNNKQSLVTGQGNGKTIVNVVVNAEEADPNARDDDRGYDPMDASQFASNYLRYMLGNNPWDIDQA